MSEAMPTVSGMRADELFLQSDAALRSVIDRIDPADLARPAPPQWTSRPDPTFRDILFAHAYDEAWIPGVLAGRSIGGPKLAPRISPNKTWAGLAGGVIGAEILGAATAYAFDLGTPFLELGGLMGLIAQVGDLYESWVKRRAGVKDSGTLLPGHGGVLDRLDGLMPVALATLLILAAGMWTPTAAAGALADTDLDIAASNDMGNPSQ